MSDEWYLGVECMDNNKHTMHIIIYTLGSGRTLYVVSGMQNNDNKRPFSIFTHNTTSYVLLFNHFDTGQDNFGHLAGILLTLH